MSISYQFGDVDAHGAMIRSQAASLEAEHQSIVRDVLAAGDFWGGWVRGLPGVHHPVGPQLPDHLRTSQQPRPKSPDRRQQHEQHRLRRRRQLGLNPSTTNCGPHTHRRAGHNHFQSASRTNTGARWSATRFAAGPMNAQRRSRLVFLCPWLTAVYLVDVAVLRIGQSLGRCTPLHRHGHDEVPGGQGGAGTGCRKPASYGRLPDSTAHIGEHIHKPVRGVIDGEPIRVMTCRRRTTQGRGERI